jgi:peptidylprolyl isomerase
MRHALGLSLCVACCIACDQNGDSTHGAPATIGSQAPRAAAPNASTTASADLPGPPLINREFPPPVDLSAPPSDAQRSSSGLISKQLRTGSQADRLTAEDYADVRYTAWRPDGSLFATTQAGTQRIDLTRQIAGLREALLQMALGEQRRLWIPYPIAFGSLPQIRNAPRTDLVYDIELVEIVRRPTAPADVASPPADAHATSSGLRSRILTKGRGTRHPTDQSRVEIRYSAFTPDGNMFESSVTGAGSITAKLSLLMQGWREGLKLMVEGERRVLWIPAKLANGELTPGQTPLPFEPPKGPLVFDVELLKILE